MKYRTLILLIMASVMVIYTVGSFVIDGKKEDNVKDVSSEKDIIEKPTNKESQPEKTMEPEKEMIGDIGQELFEMEHRLSQLTEGKESDFILDVKGKPVKEESSDQEIETSAEKVDPTYLKNLKAREGREIRLEYQPKMNGLLSDYKEISAKEKAVNEEFKRFKLSAEQVVQKQNVKEMKSLEKTLKELRTMMDAIQATNLTNKESLKTFHEIAMRGDIEEKDLLAGQYIIVKNGLEQKKKGVDELLAELKSTDV